MSPAFSIIVPVYNGALSLFKTLACLIQQTCQDFEVIIVNDGSTDRSEAVSRDFIATHPSIQVKYIYQENKGLGGARNTGIRASCGSFLTLLDQDDIWYPKKLEKVLSVFRERPEVFFVTHRLYRRVHGAICEVVYSDALNGDLFYKLLFDTNFLCGCAMSFRKEVLAKVSYFTEDRESFHLSEDYDYWLKASAAGLQFYLIEEVLGEYVMHTGNFSNDRRMMFRNEWNVVWKHYQTRKVHRLRDPWLLGRRGAKILVRQALTLLGLK